MPSLLCITSARILHAAPLPDLFARAWPTCVNAFGVVCRQMQAPGCWKLLLVGSVHVARHFKVMRWWWKSVPAFG